MVGFLSAGGSEVADDIVDALGLTGEAATSMRDAIASAEQSRRATGVIGLGLLLWSALRLTVALSISISIRLPWQHNRPGVKDRLLLGTVWLAGAAILFALTVAVGAVVNLLPRSLVPVVPSLLLFSLGVAAAFGLMLWTFWLLGERRVGWRALVPGAVAGAIGYQILTMVGTVYLPRLVRESAVLGAIGSAFAVLTWLWLFGRLVVYASTLNAVLYERRAGTVTLEIRAPRIDGVVPLEATRSGMVKDRAPGAPGGGAG